MGLAIDKFTASYLRISVVERNQQVLRVPTASQRVSRAAPTGVTDGSKAEGPLSRKQADCG